MTATATASSLSKPSASASSRVKKDAELAGGAEQNDFGIFQQRLEIGHGADADKNQQRKDFGEHAGVVEETKKAILAHHLGQRNVDQNGAETDGHEQKGS